MSADRDAVTVMGLDPGGTTGLVVLRVTPVELRTGQATTYTAHRLCTARQLIGAETVQVRQIMEEVERWAVDVVAAESFVVRQFNQSADFLAPVRINAAVRIALALGWGYRRTRFGEVRWVEQSPADAKTTATDDRLRRWGWKAATGARGSAVAGPHAQDALRHALLYLRRM